MSKLADYLLELAADPDRCARFNADPYAELACSDLDGAEKAALASRDPRTISDALTDASPDSAAVLQWLFSQFKEPGK
jgi:hypothetical protein